MVSPTTYVREVVQELRKVNWPSKGHTFRMTTLVIAVSLLVALYLGGIDYLLQRAIAVLVG